MAVPHPEDELTRLRRLLQKGLPPVVLVTGPCDHFRAEAMDLLIATVPKDAELRVIDAGELRGGGSGADEADETEEAEAGDVAEPSATCPELQDLRGGGLFARSAFTCVRRGANWWQKHGQALAATAGRFAAGSGFVLEAHKLDKRRKALATFVKDVAARGALFEFRDLYELPYDRSRSPLEGELCRWVVRRAAALGVPVTAEAAWMLVAEVGRSLPELLAELARLRTQFGGSGAGKPIGPAELGGRITCSFDSTPFEFAEAVLDGDRRRAMRSVHAMFARGVRGKDGKAGTDAGGVLPFTASWLHRALANAHDARQMLDGGVPPQELAARAGVRQFAERFVEQVERNDAERLRRGILALHHCQRMQRLSGEDPAVLLERFLAQWFDGAPIPSATDLEP
jgi:DNA polymerase III delta subunit